VEGGCGCQLEGLFVAAFRRGMRRKEYTKRFNIYGNNIYNGTLLTYGIHNMRNLHFYRATWPPSNRSTRRQSIQKASSRWAQKPTDTRS